MLLDRDYQPFQNLFHPPYPTRKRSEVITSTFLAERLTHSVLSIVLGCPAYIFGDRPEVSYACGKRGRREVKYLTKPQVQLRHHKTREEETDVTSTEDKNWGVEEHDDCVMSSHLHSSENTEFLKYEYHVIYSFSYNVPVLYFTASRQDGKLVSLDEVWDNIPDVYHERLAYEKWTFLTQQEHPYLGVPFYQLHPCHTADMMKRASSVSEERESHGSVNYLVTWLSTVGPVVGLNIPVAYSL